MLEQSNIFPIFGGAISSYGINDKKVKLVKYFIVNIL